MTPSVTGPRAFLGPLELELLVEAPPILHGPVRADAPTPLALVLDASLDRQRIRFVLPRREVEAKAAGGAYGVDGPRIERRDPLGWSGGEPPTNAQVAAAHACVNAFLDAAFSGQTPPVAPWYGENARARDLRSIGKRGSPERLPRKVEGSVNPTFQRVLVANCEFGAKGITAFVTVAPVEGTWKVRPRPVDWCQRSETGRVSRWGYRLRE